MLSPLQKNRLEYQPLIPDLLKDLKRVHFREVQRKKGPEILRTHFPKTFDRPSFQLERGTGKERRMKIGVLFSGGPASGGHNVIAGLCDAGAEMIGFLGGANGLVSDQSIPISDIGPYRNQGGFDLIGTGRTKIETAEQFASSLKAVQKHRLDGLVIIGGDDSNTNAAFLAEYFLEKGSNVSVVGVPKTIDGDLRSEDIELSFGFDSACKTYAELIGNIARDALSTKKYYHFIKLMGRSASHIALECALATHPNLTLIGEERKGLHAIVQEIADLIVNRHKAGKEYGIILIPEGLIEFVPELTDLAKELNVGKDPHGNLQISQIETEKIAIELVKEELARRKFKGKWDSQTHFFGYEGRSCLPSNFDANYGYTLGLLAAVAVREELTGVICAIKSLRKGVGEWEMKAVPIVDLMHLELRLEKQKPVIKKFLVDIKGDLFVRFLRLQKTWEVSDQYLCPGPIQFFGPPELTDSVPLTLLG